MTLPKKNPFIRYLRFYQKLAELMFNPDRYVVVSPWAQRIGHITYDIMTAIGVSVRDSKQLVIITPFKAVNKEIFKCNFSCQIYKNKDWKVLFLKTVLNSSLFLHYLYNGVRSKSIKFLPLLSKVLPAIFFYPLYGFEKGKWDMYRLKGAEYYIDNNVYLSYNCQVMLNPEQLNRGNAILKKMGMPEDSWFVCLHVREQGYVGPSDRDASILNYLQAIKYIISKGGYVVRMGDLSMKSLQPMENVVDYIFTEFKSELMDIYLISQCRFFVGSDSGYSDMVKFFKKPSCLANTLLLTGTPFYSKDMCILKHLYSKEKRRFLSLKEMSTSDLFCNDDTYSDYVLVENTPEEILESVKEYLQFLESGNFNSSDSLQEEIRNIKNQHFQYLFEQNLISDKSKELMGSLPAQGRIGSFYLERCWEYTPYLQKLTNLYNGEV